MSGTAALWLTILALGLYHGLNPAMGWPLAVASGLGERRAGAVLATMLPLAGGHLAAMAVVLLPLAALGWYVAWSDAIRLGAGALVPGSLTVPSRAMAIGVPATLKLDAVRPEVHIRPGMEVYRERGRSYRAQLRRLGPQPPCLDRREPPCPGCRFQRRPGVAG